MRKSVVYFIIFTACLRWLSDIAYKLDLVRAVESEWDHEKHEETIIHVYEKGERPKYDAPLPLHK